NGFQRGDRDRPLPATLVESEVAPQALTRPQTRLAHRLIRLRYGRLETGKGGHYSRRPRKGAHDLLLGRAHERRSQELNNAGVIRGVSASGYASLYLPGALAARTADGAYRRPIHTQGRWAGSVVHHRDRLR